jgi:PAS domain S-box-containing protein
MLPGGSTVRGAIEKGELVPVFQPFVNLRTGLVTGFEVLARWDHPRHGLILPANFISLAEQQGLIESLTEKVLRAAFTAASKAVPTLMLNVNISPLQLRSRALPVRLRALCSETGWLPEQVTIEITESAIIDNIDMASRVADDLKSMGCRLSLDDFGTGYSSLLHLQALPFDELKVDRSFIRDMVRSRESRKIVGAVLELAHNLGLQTVGEGVETEEQCELLFRLGCQRGQGWLYGMPQPFGEGSKATLCPARMECARMQCRAALQQPTAVQAASDLAAQLKALYDGAPVGLCLLDKEMRYVSINRFLADINGVPIHEHLGRTPQDVIPDIFPAIEPHIRAALAGGEPTHFELTRTGPGDGTVRTASLNYAPVYDETAEVIGVSVAAVDVTERVRAEQALRARVEHYKKFMEQSPFVPWLADEAMNVLEVSAKWCAITGMTEEQSLGMGWLQAVHPDDVASQTARLFCCLESGEAFDIQYRVRSQGREWRWVRSKGWPLFGSKGEIIGWCGYLVDVEEQKLETERMVASLREAESLTAAGGFAVQ